MQKILYVGIGGFIGASLRYIISTGSARVFGTQLPYGTLIVNVLGGILIGFIMELSIQTNIVPADLKLFLTTGILGGLTTFSTFSYETVGMISSGHFSLALLNACLNLFLSVLGVILGKSILNIL